MGLYYYNLSIHLFPCIEKHNILRTIRNNDYNSIEIGHIMACTACHKLVCVCLVSVIDISWTILTFIAKYALTVP